MAIYEFVKIDNENGPFEVPGELVETYGSSPHSASSFIALVKLSENVIEEEESGEIPVNFTDISGVGQSMGTRLKAKGIRFKSDVEESSVEELAEVDGIGEGTAEKIIEKVRGERSDDERY